jgi:hypothetical protein
MERNVFRELNWPRKSRVRARNHELFDLAQVMFKVNKIPLYLDRHTCVHSIGSSHTSRYFQHSDSTNVMYVNFECRNWKFRHCSLETVL